MVYLVLLDKINKHGGELIELLLGLGLHGLQIAGGFDDYKQKQMKKALTPIVSFLLPDLLFDTIPEMQVPRQKGGGSETYHHQ